MTDYQLKTGDLVVFRSRTDCQKVVSAGYYEDGEIESVYVTDGIETTLLKWRDRANDPVIDLSVSFEDVLKELKEYQEAALEDCGTWYVTLAVSESFGRWQWQICSASELYKHTLYGGWENASVIDWETTDEEVEEIAQELINNAVNNFTLI